MGLISYLVNVCTKYTPPGRRLANYKLFYPATKENDELHRKKEAYGIVTSFGAG